MNIPVCRVQSLYNSVKYLKDCGLQIMGASEKSNINYTDADMTTPLALVMGAEDNGISTEILSLTDTTVSLPQYGKIASLNVSAPAPVITTYSPEAPTVNFKSAPVAVIVSAVKEP